METATQASASAAGKRRPLLVSIAILFGAGCLFLIYLPCTKPLKMDRGKRSETSEPRPPEHSKADYTPAVQMRDQCRKIISALRGFHTHQQVFPVPAGSEANEKNIYPIDQAMIAAVDGSNAGLNPSQVNYFKIWALSPQTLHELKAGHFYACFDFDGDGSIPDPASPGKKIQQDILVWHAGKDGDAQTWQDNVIAWMTESQVTEVNRRER